MARKPNYGFEKRKKEQQRKQKQDAKLQRKLEETRARAEQAQQVTPPPGSGE